ncbi:MAG: HDOD domain-containing protein, partial [Oscillospiraceae bacterium]|nr:HDOD domain-containing protein [Oscillospiraceae bacterium]
RYKVNSGDYVAGYSPLLEVLRRISLKAFSADKPVFVPLSAEVLLCEEFIFPPERLVFVLDTDIGGQEPYLGELRALRRRGFRLAAQGDQPPAINNLCGYLLYDHNRAAHSDPVAFRRALVKKYPDIKLIATGIRTTGAFERAAAEEYDLFEGPFYAGIIPVEEKITPLKVNLIRLLNVVRDENFDFGVVSEIVGSDISLSVSLTRFINSPYVGARHKVKSIRQAMIILGENEVRKWVTAAVFKSLGADRPGELTRVSLMRARLCEGLAPFFGLEREAQSLFLTGLFSLLDAALGVSMERAMEMVFVAQEIQDALISLKGRYFPVLSFIRLYERADWKSVLHRLRLMELSTDDVSKIYLDALCWYSELLTSPVRPLRISDSGDGGLWEDGVEDYKDA